MPSMRFMFPRRSIKGRQAQFGKPERIPVIAALLAALAMLAASPTARAANFTCTWTDAGDNWTTTTDWSGCNSTFPNNGGGNTYDVSIPTGNPQLTSAVTIGNVTISPGNWTLTSSSASATLTGNLTNSSGDVYVDTGFADGGSTLSVGGTLTNAATVQVGTSSNNLSATATVSAANLVNSGTIDLIGSTTNSSNQAVMNIAGAAPSTLTGGYTLSGAAVLDFGSGAITSIGSGAALNENGATGQNPVVAIGTATGSNSALATLGSIGSGGQLSD
jgi:hypothetical protein